MGTTRERRQQKSALEDGSIMEKIRERKGWETKKEAPNRLS